MRTWNAETISIDINSAFILLQYLVGACCCCYKVCVWGWGEGWITLNILLKYSNWSFYDWVISICSWSCCKSCIMEPKFTNNPDKDSTPWFESLKRFKWWLRKFKIMKPYLNQNKSEYFFTEETLILNKGIV